MIIIFVTLLLGVVFVIAFNERVMPDDPAFQEHSGTDPFQVGLTARDELAESIRQYPGDEGDDPQHIRQTMNSIQKRVKSFDLNRIFIELFSICSSSYTVVASISTKIGSMLIFGKENLMSPIRVVSMKLSDVENRSHRMKLMD